MAKDKSKSEGKKAKIVAKKQKQEKKGQKKEKVKSSKANDSDAEDVDLDAVLAAYAKQQEQFLKVTESPSDPPRSRASSTLIASPTNDNELFRKQQTPLSSLLSSPVYWPALNLISRASAISPLSLFPLIYAADLLQFLVASISMVH